MADLEFIKNGKSNPFGYSKTSIDDNTTSTDKTWSSKKIDENLNNIANKLKLVGGDNNTIKLMLGTKELSSITVSGGIVEPTPLTYSITNNLVNCSNSNTATSIEENTSYSATITPSTNYKMSGISVNMGGVDITNTVVSGNNISIESVTGDIVITASAEVDTDTVVGTVDSNNNIELSGLDAGTYSLKYEDDTGILSNYDDIATMEVV